MALLLIRKLKHLPLLRKDRIGMSLLVCWGVVMLLSVAMLAVQHVASLPMPEAGAPLTRAMLELRQQSSGKEFLIHVIYAECSCSQGLFAHLLARHPFSNADEMILFVGLDPVKQESATRAGFGFTTVSAQQLASHFGLEVAPVFIMFDSTGLLRYIGGYYSSPSSTLPLDEKIYRRLAAGAQMEPLPVFGCAVSSQLERVFNPLRLL